jgi:glycosyltransferase involved in cell wall biosynthesis
MSNEAGRIRVLIYEPYPMGLGGNFLTQRLILERLDRERFEPLVMAPAEGAALDRFRALGVECAVLAPPGALGRYGGSALRAGAFGRLKSAIDLFRYNLRAARFLCERRVDVVYANGVRAMLFAGLAARLAGIPCLMYVKGELANPLIDRLCFVLASRILFFCPQNRDDKYPGFVRWYAAKIGILRIGLDPATLAEAELPDSSRLRRELDIDPAYFNAVVLAQLYRPKGQHLAVEALFRLVAEFPRTRLFLVGDHVIEDYRPYKAELEELISRRGLAGHVRFTGWRKDALVITSLMDAVIHPSLAEGFGRAVLEAMALGKPVIASAVGGLREAIRDGYNGYLVPLGDVDAIARRWRELLSDVELRGRLGREARRTVFADYLIDDKIARLAEIWADMGREGR